MALRHTTNYSDDFDGSWYIDTFYSKVEGCEEEGDFLAMFIFKSITIPLLLSDLLILSCHQDNKNNKLVLCHETRDILLNV